MHRGERFHCDTLSLQMSFPAAATRRTTHRPVYSAERMKRRLNRNCAGTQRASGALFMLSSPATQVDMLSKRETDGPVRHLNRDARHAYLSPCAFPASALFL